MKTLFRFSRFLCALTALLVCACVTFAADSDPRAEKEVREIEDLMVKGALKSDPSDFEKYIADDFINILPNGEFQTGKEFVADFKVVKFKEYKMQNMKVRIYGETAVATSLAKAQFSFKGAEMSGRFASTDVFVRRNGEWKMVSSHSTVVPDAPPAK